MTAKLQLTSSFYGKMIESLHDAVVAIDARGVVLTWNRGAEKLLGYMAREAIGCNLSLVIADSHLHDLCTHTTEEFIETFARQKSGLCIPVELSISLLEGLNSRVIVIRDRTAETEQARKLAEAERWLQMVSDNSQDIITYTLMGQGIVYVSPSIETLLGYSPHDIVSGQIELSYHPDDEVELDRFVAAIMDGVESYRITTRLKHREGHYVWFETTFKVMRDADSGLIEVLGIGRDISDRKAIQSRFEHAQRIAKVGHWERRFVENTIYWSDEVYRICGLNPTEQITHEKIESIIHPQDRARLQQAFTDAEGGAPYDIEYRIIHPTGDVRYIHSQGEPICDHDVLIGMFGSLQDITDRKQVEEAVRRSKTGLKLAHRIAGLGHWDFDLRSGEVFFSDELLRMMGVKPSETATPIEALLSTVHPDDWLQVEEMRKAFLEQVAFDVEFRVIQPDGSVRVVRSVSQITRDSDGTPSRLFGIVQDNTERKQTEEMLKRSEMLSVVGQLAAGLAHEIRNPLTSIKGFTQLLATGQVNPYLGIMQSELQRIESIVNELLALAKPQAVVYKSANITSILQDVIDLLEPQAILNDVRLYASFSEEDCFVECDANQLKQVFINIIKNAIEAMDGGGHLKIDLGCQKRCIVIAFEDSGVGISGDVLRSLGQPFMSTKPQGVGLGFMISQKIVQDHGGKIHVDSTVGVGTKVSVSLPALKRYESDI